MSYHDDEHLLAALRRREPEAFGWVFESYADKIYRLAVSLLENETEADGVVQDAFLKLIEHLARFEGRSTIGTWLYRVAYNLCQDRLRLRQRDRRWLAAEPESDVGEVEHMPQVLVDWTHSPEALLDEQELQTLLRELITTLPLTLRSVFVLRDVEGLSTAVTASALEISPSAVKVRLHRARLQLREHLSAIMADRLEETSNL